VNTAKDALRLMKLDNFDLVLCNFQLPDAVGPDCCRQMAAINPHTYRIVIAAPGDRYQNAKRLSPSAAEVIETPFRVASLVKAIAATLAGKRQVEKRTWKNLLRPAVSPC
jgi:DNA-binding NarL/FixJ family response regulator